MELWDAYDRQMNRVEGVTLVRGEPIPEGLYHLVSDILVVHADGTILLMQRDPAKTFGDRWEASAGGSALQGETPEACALRELREETGIVAGALTPLGRVTSHDTHFVGFLCRTDWDKRAVTLQKGETVAFRWVTREELLAMPREQLLADRVWGIIEKGQLFSSANWGL